MTPPIVAETRTRPGRADDVALAVAARAGDHDAAEALFRAHLPMAYNLVRQILGGGPDVDDVVQDVMVRALRQLPDLREPGSFRPWLAAITVRQASTQLARGRMAAGRTAPLEAAAWQPDADMEGPALLRVELTRQRRQVRIASRWLSAEDRALLSLWWLETAGELSRAEVAAALGLSVAHAGVRLQRMQDQLDLSRTIVAALETVPGCDELTAAAADWDGVPSPFWRKRIARHVRSCPVCEGAAEGRIPAERLLAGSALVAVPTAVADAAAGVCATGIGAVGAGGVLGRLLTALRTHPWIVAAVAGAILVAGIVSGGSMPHRSSALPAFIAPATAPASPPVLPTGRVSLESANIGGFFVSVAGGLGALVAVDQAGSAAARRRATVEVIGGLADKNCYSLRTADGQMLRHQSWRLRPARNEGTVLFKRDATFCVRAGSAAGTVSLESSNYRGWFVRHLGTELWVDQSDNSAKFRADSSFRIRPALG